jgi:biotin carboxylase
LIQDPHHEYASRFVRLLRERYGHRAIAFFTCSSMERYYRREDCLPDREFAAVYEVNPNDLNGFAARIREKHRDVQAVIPYSEETLDFTARLQQRLGLGWLDRATLERFRRKAALKDHLRRTAPSVRLNFTCPVSSASEVFSLAEALPEKFVLKPDSGWGSRGVGIFGTEQRAEIEQFFARNQDRYILEEFIEGTLYAVDGLVDAGGKVLVASIFSSGRRELNGCPVVYANGALVSADTPLFAEISAYAREVIAASGLRRSPFHMEVMRDARGPCLIEVGARLVGHSHAFTCERVHGGRFDFFGLAAAGYLGKEMDLRLSFAHYDAIQAVKVYGASEVEGPVYRLEGIERVEALPSFDRWIVKPRVGADLRRTVDLFSVPYSLMLVGPRKGEPLPAVGEAVHRTLRFETRPGSPLERLRVDGARLAAKARMRLGWMAERARRALANGRVADVDSVTDESAPATREALSPPWA